MSIFDSIRFMVTHPLTAGTPLQSFARFVRWQIGSRLVPGPIVYDWVNGAKLLVSAGETGLTGNIYAGLDEFPEMGYLLHVLRRDDLFVDVGANVGAYTILACAAVGARGVAFEPVPNTYARLIENMRINHLEQRVRCLNVGVGRESGQVAFTNALDTANHVIGPRERSDKVVSVPIQALDDAIGAESPAVIKIDVEGYETPALEGALAVLRNPTLHSIIMELNGSGNRYGYDESHIPEMMLDYGFQSYSYNPMDRQLTDISGRNRSSDNTLFIRDIVLVRDRLATSPSVTILGKEF